MSLRTFCLGLVAALGLGQACAAATTVNHDLRLRYDGTSFTEASVYQRSSDLTLFEGTIGPWDYDWGFEGFFNHLPLGAIVPFKATILYPDEPFTWVSNGSGFLDNGGRVQACSFTGPLCNATWTQRRGDDFRFGYDDAAGFDKIGNQIRYSFWGRAFRDIDPAEDIRREYEFQTVHFTVLPAPVPLPASIALIPMGIGALALLRRRRRLPV